MPLPGDAAQDIRLSSAASFAARAAEGRRFRQLRGRLCSAKMDRHVGWTSTSQRDAMTLLELQHNVRAYEAWPLQVEVAVDGERFAYHPSLGLRLRKGRRAVLDIVPSEDGGTPERAAFDVLLARALALSGLTLIVMGEDAVRKDSRLPNAREVMRAVGCPVDAGSEFACVRFLAGRDGPVTLGELHGIGPNGPKLRSTACVLAMRRVVAIDLNAPSPDECPVSLPAREAA